MQSESNNKNMDKTAQRSSTNTMSATAFVQQTYTKLKFHRQTPVHTDTAYHSIKNILSSVIILVGGVFCYAIWIKIKEFLKT